jgi:RimJ/RimL family protein N-acetyltransferase
MPNLPDLPILADGVIALRPMTVADAEAHLAGEDAELVRWLNGGRSTIGGVRRYLKQVEKWWVTGTPMLGFGIRVPPAGDLAGTMDIWLHQPYLGADEVNLSYGLYPRWRRRGFATRAVLLAFGYLPGLTGVNRAVIRVAPGNKASAAVAVRAGFAYLRQTDDEHGILDWYVCDVRDVRDVRAKPSATRQPNFYRGLTRPRSGDAAGPR